MCGECLVTFADAIELQLDCAFDTADNELVSAPDRVEAKMERNVDQRDTQIEVGVI